MKNLLTIGDQMLSVPYTKKMDTTKKSPYDIDEHTMSNRVPNNSSIDVGKRNAPPLQNMKIIEKKFSAHENENQQKMHPQRLQSQRLQSSQLQNQQRPLAIQCMNCANMAKNFLYLESFLRANSTKKSCNTCSSSLSYLQYLNRNIEEVFKNINANLHNQNAGGAPAGATTITTTLSNSKEVYPQRIQSVWRSETNPTQRTLPAQPKSVQQLQAINYEYNNGDGTVTVPSTNAKMPKRFRKISMSKRKKSSSTNNVILRPKVGSDFPLKSGSVMRSFTKQIKAKKSKKKINNTMAAHSSITKDNSKLRPRKRTKPKSQPKILR